MLCVLPQTATESGNTTTTTMSFANNKVAVRTITSTRLSMKEPFPAMHIWFPSDREEIRYSTEKVKKKKPKGSGKVKKVIPPLKSIEEELAIIEDRVAKMESENFGRTRGRHAVKEIVRAEKINKKVNMAVGKLFANDWLYSRHALRNGYRHINQMPQVALSESLLGKGTKIHIALRDVKAILKEQFRYGTSVTLNKYEHLRDEREKKIKQIEINRQRNMARRGKMEEEEKAARDLHRKQKKAERLARRQAKAQANQEAADTTTANPAATTDSSNYLLCEEPCMH
jgi:hypothetical protein